MQGTLKMSQKLSTGKSSSVLLQGKEEEERSSDSINRFSVGIYFFTAVSRDRKYFCIGLLLYELSFSAAVRATRAMESSDKN